MATDTLRAAMRWQLATQELRTVAGECDRLIATISAAGWSAEAIQRIREGVRLNHVSKSDLRNENAISAWNEFVEAVGDGLGKRLKRIRDKCAFHWDERIASQFLENENWCLGVSLIESDKNGDFLATRYPWAQAAIAFDMLDCPPELTMPDARAVCESFVKDLLRAAPVVSGMASDLVAAMICRAGLTVELRGPE